MRIFERLRERTDLALCRSNAGVAAHGEANSERIETPALRDEQTECSSCYPNAKARLSRRL
jgi:hypothetical protein